VEVTDILLKHMQTRRESRIPGEKMMMFRVMRTFHTDRLEKKTVLWSEWPTREAAEAEASTRNSFRYRRPVHPELVAEHGLMTPPEIFTVEDQ
jgi:hypothetical protein